MLIHQFVHWLDANYASSTHEAEQNIPGNVQRITSEAEPEAAASHGIVHRASSASDSEGSQEALDIQDERAIEVTAEPPAASSPVQVALGEESQGAASSAAAPIMDGTASPAHGTEASTSRTPVAVPGPTVATEAHEAEKRALTRTGLITALAIGLHNFPELVR